MLRLRSQNIAKYGVRAAPVGRLTICPLCRGPLRYGKFSKPAAACFVTNASGGFYDPMGPFFDDGMPTVIVCVGPKRASHQKGG